MWAFIFPAPYRSCCWFISIYSWHLCWIVNQFSVDVGTSFRGIFFIPSVMCVCSHISTVLLLPLCSKFLSQIVSYLHFGSFGLWSPQQLKAFCCSIYIPEFHFFYFCETLYWNFEKHCLESIDYFKQYIHLNNKVFPTSGYSVFPFC